MSNSPIGAPQWWQLAEQLRTRIRSGDLPPRAQIPTEAELESVTGLSRTTVRRAVAELRTYGLVVTRAPHGTYVADSSAPVPFSSGDTATSTASIIITHADGSTDMCPPGAVLTHHSPAAR